MAQEEVHALQGGCQRHERIALEDRTVAAAQLAAPGDEKLQIRLQGSVIAHATARELDSGLVQLGNARRRVEPTVLNSELMVDPDGSLHQMSEWMFETSPTSREAPFPVGTLDTVKDINVLRWSRFHSYYTLATMYEGNPEVRAALLNNISFGLRVGRFFRSAGGRLGRVPA